MWISQTDRRTDKHLKLTVRNLTKERKQERKKEAKNLWEVYGAGAPTRLHLVRQRDITRPHIEPKPLAANEAAERVARVHAHAHIHVHAVRPIEALDLPHHPQTHLHAAARVPRLPIQTPVEI